MFTFLFWLLWPNSGVQDKIDEYGVMFEDSSRRVLVAATHAFENFLYVIPSTTVEIKGGALEKSPFYLYKSSLKTLKFDKCHNLETLGMYCFSELIITEIDMSSCTKLLYLSECCFKKCHKLSKIIFPPNLQTLKMGSLNNLIAIKEFNFPSSLKRIENFVEPYGRTCGECSLLANVSWGENPSIENIGSAAFAFDGSLKSIFIPATLKSINNAVFSLCPIELIKVDGNNTAYSSDGTSLYTKEFYSLVFCPPTKTGVYTLNENVKVLNANSLADTKFSEVILSPVLTTIGGQCFISSLIQTIEIPSNVTSISDSVFLWCRNLKTIRFNASVKSIPSSMCNGCLKLDRFIIPRSVVEIKSGAFSGCAELDYVFIPNTVTKIETGVFSKVNGSVILDFESDEKFKFYDSKLVTGDNKVFMAYIGDSTKEIDIIIEKTIEKIGISAFLGYKVKKLEFEPGSLLKIIESSAFKGSTMESVTLPDGVEEIHESAFEACTNLKAFSFGQSLITIKDRAFAQSAIERIKLPSTTKSLGKEAFADCKSILSFTYSSLENIGQQCFARSSLESIIIKPSTRSIGPNSFEESELRTIIFEEKEEPWSIGEYSFRNAKKLNQITFSEGIEEIGLQSFERCEEIEILTLSDSIESISSKAFSGCVKLREVKVGSNSVLRTIGPFAFEKCPNFFIFDVSEENQFLCASKEKDVLFNKNMTEIILYLPATNRSLFEVPNSVEQIGAYSFHGAEYLEVVNITEAPITYIGFGAFAGCKNLRRINLPENIETISSFAFDGCESLACGSFLFTSADQREALKEQLLAARAPEDSLYYRATQMFTVASYDTGFYSLLVSSIIAAQGSDNTEFE